ncbi:MAG: hypothetical protein ACD_46C00163G0005 [uncultured bacterium]|nr:MAG: hypothetical protein ACD_46C00163G0005 [uncultured bacterium]
MYTNNRDAYRNAFFTAWQKHLKKLPLEPFEIEMVEVILMHPEYHLWLEKSDASHTEEFILEENPFLHLGLHITIREQIKMNRPAGISEIYQSLLTKMQNVLDVEHAMMTCLANMMWQAQQTGTAPSEADYLQKLREI